MLQFLQFSRETCLQFPTRYVTVRIIFKKNKFATVEVQASYFETRYVVQFSVFFLRSYISHEIIDNISLSLVELRSSLCISAQSGY